jgi:hypothetical protein
LVKQNRLRSWSLFGFLVKQSRIPSQLTGLPPDLRQFFLSHHPTRKDAPRIVARENLKIFHLCQNGVSLFNTYSQ